MSSSPFRILCVDDDIDTCELIEAMLVRDKSDYQITTQNDPQKALSQIKEKSFDLYIFDYAMPFITGIDLCRAVRQDNIETPVMFFSAMVRESDKELAFKAGASEFLIKPNDLDKLVTTIKRLLNRNSSVFIEGL